MLLSFFDFLSCKSLHLNIIQSSNIDPFLFLGYERTVEYIIQLFLLFLNSNRVEIVIVMVHRQVAQSLSFQHCKPFMESRNNTRDIEIKEKTSKYCTVEIHDVSTERTVPMLHSSDISYFTSDKLEDISNKQS